MTSSANNTIAISVRMRGRYDHGFTILSDMLRDEWGEQVGGEAAYLAYLIISWAGNGERGARLSFRYLKTKTRWSADKINKAKDALLEAFPVVFTRVKGDQATSRPETWWVDFDVLFQMHAAYLQREQERRATKRGPGRPKKPVPGIEAGFAQTVENPVPGINTGFPPFGIGFGENLFRKSGHPCSGNRSTPVLGTGAHTHISKDIAQDMPNITSGADAPGGQETPEGVPGEEQAPNVPPVTPQPAQTPDGAAARAAEEGISSLQCQDKGKANAKSGKATSKREVPAAGGADAALTPEHTAMLDAIRAALYPGVPRCAERIEVRMAAASRQLRGAGLSTEAPKSILQHIRTRHAWRNSITPESLVEYSAEWASAQTQPSAGDPSAMPAQQQAVKKGFLR